MAHSVMSTYRSIWMLVGAQPNEQYLEAAQRDIVTLIRKQADALIQNLYILNDDYENKMSEYLDFQWVERSKMLRRIDNDDTVLSQGVKESPRKAEGEKRIRVELDRIRKTRDDNFIRKSHWYSPLGLESIASSIGLKMEYDFMVNFGHGSVHSSPLAVVGGASMRGPLVHIASIRHVMRFAKVVTHKFDLQIHSDAREVMESLWEQL